MAERTGRFIEMEWLRKERIRELLRNFSNHLRMARRVNSTGMPCVSANLYKLEVSLTQHQHIDDDKVVGIGFELTLGGRAVSSPGF